MPSSTQIFVYMAGQTALSNYQNTIVQGVDLDGVIEHINDSTLIQKLRSAYQDDICYVWAIRRGKLISSVWSGMQDNDFALAYGSRSIRSYSRVLGKVESSSLGLELWNDQKFELVFFLSKPVHLDKPIEELSESGYIADSYKRFSKVGDTYLNTIRDEFGSVEEFISSIGGEDSSVSSENYPFSQNFERLLEEYCNACTDTPWLKQDEIYKFKFAEWVYDKTDIENQTDEEVLEIFQESQQQAYIPGSNAKGINFILSGQRYSDSFVSLQDVRCMREMVTRGNVDSEPVEEHDITFPKLSVWLSCLDPARFKHYAFSDLHYGLSQIFAFRDNFPKKGYKAFQFAQKLLRKLEQALQQHPIIKDSVVDVLSESLEKNELSEVNWAWLAQDFALYVTRNQENVMPIKRNFWWVNQGLTYKAEAEEGFIWAPKKDKSGNEQYHWTNVSKVKKGDLVCHYNKSQQLVAISLANQDAYDSAQPADLEAGGWENDGWKGDQQYFELEYPIPKKKITSNLSDLGRSYGPFNSEGNANQGYLFDLNEKEFIEIVTQLDIEHESDELRELLAPYLELKIAKKHYWWITANPAIWDFHEKDIGETVIYTSHTPAGNKSRIYENFEHVQVGDQAIGYTASPERVVKALLEITKELGDTEEGEGIEFKKTADLEDPISWDTIKALPEMANSQPLKTSQGSLFKLEEKEYKAIMKLVQASPDIFMSEDEFENILNILKMKKNIILQGPPGVGKTFISEHIAYELIGSRDKSAIETIQFHQSYSYEDFMQGYRPTEKGGFKLKNGIFFNFCEKAKEHPEKKFCFIIDEINRGNLSKIFGELMLLIEKDKRGNKVVLTYSESSDDKFSIPENVYLIGTMNTADRSLAMVDYALRRRFGFISMTPQFDSPRFKAHLVENNVPNALVNKIIDKLTTLNNGISEEKKTLGSGYQIGHSYFCADDSEVNYDEQWYKNVVIYELKPLLEEYWFDDEDKAKVAVRDLLS